MKLSPKKKKAPAQTARICYGENAGLRKEMEEFIAGAFGKTAVISMLPEKRERAAPRSFRADPFEDFSAPGPLKAHEHLPWERDLPADPMSAMPNPPAPLPINPAF